MPTCNSNISGGSSSHALGAPRAVRTKAPRKRTAADEVLGCFVNVPPSPFLDHLIRYLSTWSGTDKMLMLTQYGSKVLIAILSLQHRLRLRLQGTRQYHAPHGGSSVAKRLAILGALCSDGRTLYRIWGVLPIVKWMIAMERQPPPTRLLHNIERIQGWSMLLYGPMEAVAYLGGKSIIGLTPSTQNKLWLASSRLWALYVMLQCLHLVEDNRMLRLRARALERTRGHPVQPGGRVRGGSSSISEKGGETEGYDECASARAEEQAITRSMWSELDLRKSAILNELWVNIGYLPLTIHWSLPGGMLNDATVGVFGLIAATAGFRNGWRASAEPKAPIMNVEGTA
ncbi:hypothetical protein K437DRAFT_258568 [Tilletiaria anomala UBC 951]|uniref:Peroxisomal biogenesis factor 11 n=1 Tax=Tilletiaria anomala (strain ATCC 24038 / CBS 436.72 / UBC 951) TaxID=1037660 RepID=A0A066VQ24_TILAU|nr:uncharacterized protein K437DRAFT_258568 [Tilletiaria anomala UBC 951]KDN40700.1 hypothetical protein K437DRAFT_258568 [Tilletiaria anomala UBC 951]